MHYHKENFENVGKRNIEDMQPSVESVCSSDSEEETAQRSSYPESGKSTKYPRYFDSTRYYSASFYGPSGHQYRTSASKSQNRDDKVNDPSNSRYHTKDPYGSNDYNYDKSNHYWSAYNAKGRHHLNMDQEHANARYHDNEKHDTEDQYLTNWLHEQFFEDFHDTIAGKDLPEWKRFRNTFVSTTKGLDDLKHLQYDVDSFPHRHDSFDVESLLFKNNKKSDRFTPQSTSYRDSHKLPQHPLHGFRAIIQDYQGYRDGSENYRSREETTMPGTFQDSHHEYSYRSLRYRSINRYASFSMAHDVYDQSHPRCSNYHSRRLLEGKFERAFTLSSSHQRPHSYHLIKAWNEMPKSNEMLSYERLTRVELWDEKEE